MQSRLLSSLCMAMRCKNGGREGGAVGGAARRATGELVGTKKGARALIPLPLRDDRREGGRRGKKIGTAVGGGGRRG